LVLRVVVAEEDSDESSMASKGSAFTRSPRIALSTSM